MQARKKIKYIQTLNKKDKKYVSIFYKILMMFQNKIKKKSQSHRILISKEHFTRSSLVFS